MGTQVGVRVVVFEDVDVDDVRRPLEIDVYFRLKQSDGKYINFKAYVLVF